MIGRERYVTELEDALDEVRDAPEDRPVTVAPVVRLDTGAVQGYFVTYAEPPEDTLRAITRSLDVTGHRLSTGVYAAAFCRVGSQFWVHTWRLPEVAFQG